MESTIYALPIAGLVAVVMGIAWILKSISSSREYKSGYRVARKFVGSQTIHSSAVDAPDKLSEYQSEVYRLGLVAERGLLEDKEKLLMAQINILRAQLSEKEQESEKLLQQREPQGANSVEGDVSVGREVSELQTLISDKERQLMGVGVDEIPSPWSRVGRTHQTIWKALLSKLPAAHGSTWFVSLLIAIDYIIAIQFFSDIAKDYTGLVLRYAMGYVFPLAITLITLWFAHKAHDALKKNESSAQYYAFFAGLISLLLLAMRLYTANETGAGFISLLQELLTWTLWCGVVIFAAIESFSGEHAVHIRELLYAPMTVFIWVMTVALSLLISPILIIEALIALLSYFFPRRTRRSILLAEIVALRNRLKKVADRIQSSAAGLSRQRTLERDNRLKEIGETISERRSAIETLEADISSIKFKLGDLRRGSNDGTLDQLSRMLKPSLFRRIFSRV